MKITSFGGSEGVTGSCHLVDVGSTRILLDCGLFQGGRELRERNADDFGFDPSTVDCVLISHAHLDHIGRLPLLFKRGFRGKIVSTRPTFDLARINLLDCASILDMDARRQNRRRKAGDPEVFPIYETEDVLDILEYWVEFYNYGEVFTVGKGVTAQFQDAGHILGSATILLTLKEEGITRRVAFSGDLGNKGKPIIRDPSPCLPADIVLVESTYGDRDHRSFEETVDELEGIIRETFACGGNVIIPSFALERSQELLYVLHEAWHDDRIPEGVQIFLDSPLAISATNIFRKHPEFYDCDTNRLLATGRNPFDFAALAYTRETSESIAINQVRQGAIIIAGSGMVTGGRVIHHLRHNLLRPESSVVFCGFQAAGTPGRRIVDGAKFVSLHGTTVPCDAQVHTVNGFSGHAGQHELANWVASSKAKEVWMVHGEESRMVKFAMYLHKRGEYDRVEPLPYGISVSLEAPISGAD